MERISGGNLEPGCLHDHWPADHLTNLRDSGDIEGARQQMRDVLAVEFVPQYRRMAEEQLRGLDSLSPEK